MEHGPDPRGVYFDAEQMHDPQDNYVCWLDVMGTANQMLRSLPTAANFIFKLQCAILEARDETESVGLVRLYPVMDGMYVTSQRREPLQKLLNQTLCRLAITFLNETAAYHQFLVRGAVAFGPVYHGRDLGAQASVIMTKNVSIRDSILLGVPMAQAYSAEKDAPPFGVAVDTSARAFAPSEDKPFRFLWPSWFRYCTPQIDPSKMLERIGRYFDWQRDHCNFTGYKADRIEYHRTLAKEFFSLVEESPGPTVTRQ